MLKLSKPTLNSGSLRTLRLGIALCFGLLFILSASARELSQLSVVQLLQDSKILGTDSKFTADINGKEIFVSTYLNPKANDNDCKIDAILIAKKIFDSYAHGSFNDIRVNFYETSDSSSSSYRSVIIRAGDVEVFGKGAISEKALLASIGVAHEKVRQPSLFSILNVPIQSGMHKEERRNLLNLIRDLQAKNLELKKPIADIAKCCQLFAVNEAAVKCDDPVAFTKAFNNSVIAVNEEQARLNAVIKQSHQPGPLPGPEYQRRLAIFNKLHQLEGAGQNVFELKRIYTDEVEPLAKTGQDSIELQASIKTLERAISQYRYN